MDELKNDYPPELANRFFDTLTVQKGLSKILIDFPAALLQIVLGLLLLSFYHPFFIIYGILLILLGFLLFKSTAKKGLATSLSESKKKYNVAHWIQEVARSLISFKNSGRTSLAMKKNDELTAAYLDARESHFKVLMLQFTQMIGFKVLVTLGLLLIGGLLVINQQMNIGQFVAAEIIILLLISSVEKVITGLESFYDVLTSLEKIGQVVDKELESQKGEDPFAHENSITAELNDITYNAPDGEEVLKGVSLSISPKDRIHITGPSGSGKTTFLKIISGLIPATSGTIYVNNISIKAIWPNMYRANIGQVLPDQTPFEGTIIENITFNSKDFDSKRLDEVLKQTGLLEFVKKQSLGIHTVLHPEGQRAHLGLHPEAPARSAACEGDGAAGLETALEAAGHNITFNDLYLDWMTALTIDEEGFADDRFCYRGMDAIIQDYTTIETLPFQDDSVPLYCYGSKVYRIISPPDCFRIEMSQPAEEVAGLSVAYRDLHGWHVQQIQEEGTAVVQVSGDSIEIAHVIASYLYAETPAGENDFGSGPSETVQIVIQEWNETSNTPITSPTPPPSTDDHTLTLLVAAGSMPLSATLVVLFLIIKRKEKEKLGVS